MEWVIGIVVLLVVLGAIFGGGKEKPKRRSSKTTSPAAARGGREYATIFENDKHHPVTSDQVAEMFAGIRERLKDHRKAAKAMQKLADKLLETGKLDDAAYAALSHAERDAGSTRADAEALNDKLYFESESASERYYKFVDDLSEAEADIEDARAEIVSIQQDIEDDEFVPQKRAKPKT